jgi:tetratricopeptide (TPR) repeat protein
MLNLQFCVSQEQNAAPYTFKTTGIRVYSFEELMYHAFHFWRESGDEIFSDGVISWVAEIGHSYLAARMKELSEPAKMMDFLRLVNYFDENELAALQTSLEKWEARREWEQLKERADFFAEKKECHKAIPLYKRALRFNENAAILNNLGVQYMQISATKEALSCLTRALSLEPNNFSILLHYIEAAILNDDYEKAAKAIARARASAGAEAGRAAEIAFLLGLISFRQKDFSTALNCFEKANDAFKIADVHIQMRQYEKALAAIQKVTERSADFYAKEAEIYAASGDISRAITSLNFAIRMCDEPDAALFAKLAAYHRQDYSPALAEIAIQKALEISPENNTVRLENARIKKGLGRTREYQAALNEILKSFKDDYRKTKAF